MTRPAQDPPRSGRSTFKRTKVSVLERTISISIVGLLAAIGIAVWIAGRHFDPGLYSLRTEALKSTEAPAAVTGGVSDSAKPRTGGTPMTPDQADSPQETPDGYEAAAKPAAESPGTHDAPAPAVESAPSPKGEPIEISGATPMGDTEFYSPETLYEKIDGRAPAYLEFGFQQLRCRSFSEPGNAGSYVDVYEYRMDSPVNAFGIFALERDPTGKPLDFAPDGYSGEMGYFFRQGNCYVQVISSDQKPGTQSLAKSVAENIAKSVPSDDTGLGARRRLPAQGIIPESVVYTQDNAQGQAFLKDVFQADYNFEGEKIAFFLMVSTPEAAAKAWESYLTFSGRYGGKAEPLPDVAGAKVFKALNFGKWKLIYQRGGELGGVIDAQDPVAASAFLNKVLEGTLH